jgi:RNA polymerase sigma-70 factor, ECF subfamily
MLHDETQRQFETLLAPILGQAFGVAMQMTHNRDDAEDLVQEAAVQAFRAFHTFQPGTNFKAWYFKILTNLFLNKRRKQQRQPATTALDDAPDLYLFHETKNAGLHERSSDPAALVLQDISAEQMLQAIAALPEDYRTVSALYFIEELAYQEIADIVDCPVGTVRSRLHRSRKLLQKALWEVAQEQGIVARLTADKSNEN